MTKAIHALLTAAVALVALAVASHALAPLALVVGVVVAGLELIRYFTRT